MARPDPARHCGRCAGNPGRRGGETKEGKAAPDQIDPRLTVLNVCEDDWGSDLRLVFIRLLFVSIRLNLGYEEKEKKIMNEGGGGRTWLWD